MIWLILLVGFVLRVISLNQSFWLDEAINVVAAKNYSLIDLLTEYAKADFHPPGYFILLWIWGRIFDFSEIAVRLPSVIFGLLTVWMVFLIGSRLVTRQVGILAALLLAINPLHIYYSQEARMYSLAALAVSLNMLLFVNFVKGDKEDVGSRVTYVLGNLLVLISDYVAYLIFPAQFIFLLLQKIQKTKRWFVYLLISLVGFVFWLPTFLGQLGIGINTISNIPQWKEVVGTFGLKGVILTYVKFIIGRISHPNDLIYGGLFLPAGFLFLLLIWKAVKSASLFNRDLLLLWLGIPIIGALIISIFIPIYSYFRLLFLLPPFLLLVALGIFSFKSKLKYLFVWSVIIVELSCSLIYLLNPVFHREDWRGLVSFLKTLSKEDAILVESTGAFAPLTYYGQDQIRITAALKKFPAEGLGDLENLENLGPSIYLIDYLVDISDPNRLVSKELGRLNYIKQDIKNFRGIGFVYHFRKNE